MAAVVWRQLTGSARTAGRAASAGRRVRLLAAVLGAMVLGQAVLARVARAHGLLAQVVLAPVVLAQAVVAVPAHAAGAAADVAAAFAKARYSQVDGGQGVPLNVVEVGDAARPAIVFIHGYRQSHLSWFAQFGSTLAARCHLVAFDLRGHGDSGAPWQAGGYDGSRPWADDLAQVIRATGAQRPLLVGWSFGGNVAMDFLRENASVGGAGGAAVAAPPAVVAGPAIPDIAGLVLVASTGALLPRTPGPPRSVPRVGLADRVAATARSTDLVYGPGVGADVKAVLAAASLRTSPFIDSPTAARAPTLSNADLLPQLRLPLVLVNGGRDAVVPADFVLRLKAVLPAARVADFPDSGHAPFADDPERFNALLDAMHCRAPS